MTVVVEVNHIGVIVNTPPIVHRFVGQPLDNLVLWMKKQPGFRMEEWNDDQINDYNAGYQ